MANELISSHLKLHRSLARTPKTALAFGASDTVKSFTLEIAALTHTIIVIIPNWTNAVTAVLSIENADSDEVFSSGPLFEDSTHDIITEVPLIGLNTIKLTLSGAPGGSGGTANVTVYIQGN